MGKTLWAGVLEPVQMALYYLMIGLTVSVFSIAFRTCTGWVPRHLGPSAESGFEDGDHARAKGFVPGGGFGGGKGFNTILGTGLALILAVVAVIWLLSGFYMVYADQQGVVLRFGEWVKTTPPGRNWHLPYPIETVLIPNVKRINVTDIGYRFLGVEQRRDVEEESLMVTGDQNIIDIDFVVQWKIADAGKFLFNNKNPEETVKIAAESAMREIIGHIDFLPALTESRGEVEAQTKTLLQEILTEYQAGIEITELKLQDVQPPPPVIDAFRDVQRALQDRYRMRNEADAYRNDILPRARGEAQRVIQEAEAYKECLINEANGEAQRFLSAYEAYRQKPEAARRRMCWEIMQGIYARMSSGACAPAPDAIQKQFELLKRAWEKASDEACGKFKNWLTSQ